MDQQQKFTILDLIDCAQRELALRRRVYPRWVFQERMSQETAQREIRLMRAILDNLENQAQLRMF